MVVIPTRPVKRRTRVMRGYIKAKLAAVEGFGLWHGTSQAANLVVVLALLGFALLLLA